MFVEPTVSTGSPLPLGSSVPSRSSSGHHGYLWSCWHGKQRVPTAPLMPGLCLYYLLSADNQPLSSQGSQSENPVHFVNDSKRCGCQRPAATLRSAAAMGQGGDWRPGAQMAQPAGRDPAGFRAARVQAAPLVLANWTLCCPNRAFILPIFARQCPLPCSFFCCMKKTRLRFEYTPAPRNGRP